MGNAYPAPTLYNPEKSTGRDFLGQQSIIQYMADKCLPSFTNATRKVRYYSFWAWAFKMLEIHGQNLAENQKWWYLLKLETALIIINRYIDPNIVGMPGITGIPYTVDEITKFEPDTVVKIYDEKIRATSYDAVQYAPSLGSLNIVRKVGTKFTICPFGQELFAQFDRKIKSIQGYNLLISPDTKEIKFSYLLEMKDAFSFKGISEAERDVLIRIIEQQTSGISSTRKKTDRIETTLLVLDIIRHGNIIENGEVLIKLWSDDYEASPDLKQIADGWKIIEARRFYQISIEAILSAFCQYLCSFKSETGDFDEFCLEIANSFKKFKNKEALPFSQIIEKDRSLKDFIEAVNKYCIDNSLEEESLVSSIKKYSNEQSFNYELAQFGLILLLYLFMKFDSLKALNTEKAAHFWKTPANFRHSFEIIDRFIRRWSQLPISSGLRNIIHHLCLRLHLGVSQDKWLQTGNFTFRYIKNEPKGFKFLNAMSPNRTGNKLLAYIELITDLGLIDSGSDCLRLTNYGYDFIEKYQTS
jgi:hypothetical protein